MPLFKPGENHRKSAKPNRRIDFRQPTWQTFYWLGLEASKHLDVRKSFVEIGQAFGMTKQNANTACLVALGKVVFAMRKMLK